MFNVELNVEEDPIQTTLGRMPVVRVQRKNNISSRGVQPPNASDGRCCLNDNPSKGYSNEETLRLRYLIFHFTKWFRPLISDVLSQEENLAKFEELALEGVGDIVVQEEDLAKFEEITQEGLSDIVVQQQNPSNPKHTESHGGDVEVGAVNINHCEPDYLDSNNSADDNFQQPTENVITPQKQNARKQLDHQVLMDCNVIQSSVNPMQRWSEPADEGTENKRVADSKIEDAYTTYGTQGGGSTILTSMPAIQQGDMCSINHRDNCPNEYHSKGYGDEELRLRHIIFHFTKWFQPLISEILAQEENLAKFKELAQEGVDESVTPLASEGKSESAQNPVPAILEHTQVCEDEIEVGEEIVEHSDVYYSNPNNDLDDETQGIQKTNSVTKSVVEQEEENKLSIKQRDSHQNDHHSMQYRNNNDNGETLRLEKNLAKLEELAQEGVLETVIPLALGGICGSVQQPNQSIIEHAKVCEGDVKGGESHVEYPNTDHSDPDNDFDDEIEQIKVDAITSKRQKVSSPLVLGYTDPNLDRQVLTDGDAIQSSSTYHPSMKLSLFELARCGTPNEDSGSQPSKYVQQGDNSPSDNQRLDLNAQAVSDIALGEKEGRSKSEHKGSNVEAMVPSSMSGATRKSAEENIQTVLKWLSDENVETVVIKGAEGIGRRWTARHVMDTVVKSNLFDVVIWVNSCYGSQNMQMQIIDQLKLPSTTWNSAEKTGGGLRQKIYESLVEKRFLLILDQIMQRTLCIPYALGIPPSNQRNKSSKVLTIGTTYYVEHAVAGRVLSMNALPFDEAWFLFCDKARLPFDSPDIHSIAEALVKCCYGVPLDIILLAGALKNIKVDTSLTLEAELEIANNLRTSRSLDVKEFSYAMLPSKAMKACFLYCTLYPANHHISVKGLITSWIMEGFIGGFDCLENAYEEGQHILKGLIDRYLLFKSDDKHVVMHVSLVHRQTYIKDEGSDMILAKADLRLTIPELYTEHDSFSKIFMMDGSLQTKYNDDCQEFSEPSTLLLHGNGRRHLTIEIPDAFFQQMQNLRVLALLRAGMRSLPSSLSNLNELCVLVLSDCGTLENLNHIQGLSKLEVLILSGAHALKEIPDDFFVSMCRLQALDLSETQIEYLPSSLSNLSDLRRLILRGCSYLEELSYLEAPKYLEVLDLSGAGSLSYIDNRLLENKTSLKLLDLSGTALDCLPSIPNQNNIEYLLLRGCPHFDNMPCLEAFKSLKVLDLSGTSALRELQNESFGFSNFLRILDFSGSQLVQLPSLFKCKRLRQLRLRGCSDLETLPPLNIGLEVLDLLGASSFKNFQDEILGYNLRTLDLSRTQVVHVPSFSENGLLFQLLLRDCLKLETLPSLETLKRLDTIDLSGSTAFKKFQDESFGQHLRILNLSQTQVSQLSFLSNCHSLRQLLLSGCSNLQALPHLEALTRLEVLNLSGATTFKKFQDESFENKNWLRKLDISGTQVEQLPSISKCNRLSQLLLRGCSKLEEMPPLEGLTRLKVLHLTGATAFRRFSDESFGTDWGNMMNVPKQDVGRSHIHVTIGNSDFFRSIGKNSQLWEKFFQRFHVCLCSLEEQGKEEGIYFQGKEFSFRDTYYTQIRWLPQSAEPNKFLEIRGFQSFPSGIEEVLSHAELLYLKKNDFITRLSDIGAENVKVMRECWIESCDGMKSVFYEEAKENVALGRSLQTLWVSNLSELRSLYEGVVQAESFICLKNLYIDCCPSLITIFTSGLELKNLEILHIQFCDEFESVFGETVSGESAVPRLCKLTLWKLSELKSICDGVLPSIRNLKVGGCPKLQTLPLEVNRTSPPQIEIKGEQQWWKKLKWEDEGIKSHLRFTQL